MGQPARNGRVLLVEDDSDMAQMYRLQLEMDGYQVAVAPDCRSGLAMITEFAPDLVLLDVGLPGKDGLALLDAMRQEEGVREIPILILTNNDDPALKRRSLELGARDFLRKSQTSPSDLAAQVKRWSRTTHRQ